MLVGLTSTVPSDPALPVSIWGVVKDRPQPSKIALDRSHIVLLTRRPVCLLYMYIAYDPLKGTGLDAAPPVSLQ